MALEEQTTEQPDLGFDPKLDPLKRPAVPSFDPRAPNIWDPTQAQPRPQQPQAPATGEPQTGRVAPDQTAQAGSFTSGTPTPPTPQLPPASRPFGLPPFQKAPQQTYIPAAADRPPEQWGKDPPFQALPQSWELPGMYKGIGAQLAQWGPGSTAPFAAMMGQFASRWQVGYLKGQEFLARQNHERMVWAAQELEIRKGQQLNEYSQIFATFTDPENPHKYDAQLKQAILNAAAKFHDDKIVHVMDQLGLDGAKRYIEWYDAKHRDLRAANKQRQADEKRDEEDDPYLGTAHKGGIRTQPRAVPEEDDEPGPKTPDQEPPEAPPPGGDSTPQAEKDKGADPLVDPDPQPISDEPAEPQKESELGDQQQPGRTKVAARGDVMSDAPQPGVKPGPDEPVDTEAAEKPQKLAQESIVPKTTQAPAAAAAQPAAPIQSDVLDEAQRRFPNLNRAQIEQAAEDAFLDPKWAGVSKKSRSWGVIMARKLEMETRVKDILQNPRMQDKPDAVYRAIKAAGLPTIASHVQQYVEGKEAPPKGANVLRPPFAQLFALAHKADHTIDQTTFANRAGTLRSFSSGQDGRNLTSIATAYSHGHNYIQDLQRLKEWEGENPGLWKQLQELGGTNKFAKRWLDVPQDIRELFARLNNEMDTFGTEYERALTGGKPTVTGRQEQIERMNWKTQDVDAAISDARNKIQLLDARMQKQKQRFTSGIGRQPGAMLNMFDLYSKEGRGSGSDELGGLSVPDANTARVVRWMIEHPGATLPTDMIGATRTPTALPGSTPQRGGQQSLPPPKPGAIEDGYRYKGGDPREESSWEKQ